jgi:gamma-glutamyl-gamma-aminobutyrate hydrolase PuuD
MNSGLLLTHETASIIGISDAHCRQLANKLACNDVEESLIDKRIGQSQDFRVDSIHKAEIIRQFAARAVTGHSIASDVLTEMVNNQTQTTLSSRTVRWHMNKLGLTSIKNTLPELVEELKKTPEAAC